MIQKGTFSECIKTGVFFSILEDDRVFTGDLFYDFVKREFQVRGIPSYQGKRTHILPVAERGPVAINLLILSVDEEAARDSTYSDLRFKKARAASGFVTWLEEWYGDRSVMQAIENFWEIAQDLAWVKG